MKSLLALVMLVSLSAFAKEGGNGGDVIVCRDGNGDIKSIELLDYYEARQMRKFPVLEYPSMTDEQFLKMIGNKLNSMDDSYSKFNLKEATELLASIRTFIKSGQSSTPGILFTNEVLSDITDSEELFIPRGCYVEQIAIWQFPSFPEDPRFIIQADLLKKLSDRDIRGLVLHEIIYKFLFTRMEVEELKDSYSARYLHEKLMGRKIEEFTFGDYFAFIRGMYYRQGTAFEKAFIKKANFYLEIYQAIPQTDGTFEMRIIGSDITIVLNKEGKIDRAATMKTGTIRISPYIGTGIGGWDPGRLFVTFSDIPLVDPNITHYIGMHFGENLMRVTLNPYGGTGPAGKYGLTFKGTNRKDNYVTIVGAPEARPRSYSKKFYVDFTDNFEVVIKDLP